MPKLREFSHLRGVTTTLSGAVGGPSKGQGDQKGEEKGVRSSPKVEKMHQPLSIVPA